MKRITEKANRHAVVVPAVTAFVAIALVGYALVRLGARSQGAEQRVLAEDIADRSAEAIEKLLHGALVSVHDRAAEVTESGQLNRSAGLPHEAQQKKKQERAMFLVSDDKVVDKRPTYEAVFEDMESTNSTIELAGGESELEPAQLVGPLRMAASGEWVLVLRMPVLSRKPGTKRVAGWVAIALPMDDLLHSSGLAKLSTLGYDYQLSLSSSQESSRILSRSTEFPLKNPVKKIVFVGVDQLALLMAPKDGWFAWPGIVLQSMLVSVFALGGGLSTYHLSARRQWFRQQTLRSRQRLRTANRRLMEEIQQREELEKQFSHASYHDALTGLPNRRYFMDSLERALSRNRKKTGSLLAVILLDLDRFKNINESLGHEAGDELLLQAAQRFASCRWPFEATIAHFGGDEFGFLLSDISSIDAAITACESLQHTLMDPLAPVGQNVFVTASMGISLSSSGYEYADELVRGADIALSRAKIDGRGRWSLFDPNARDQIVTRHQLETDLHRAIERREFRLNFQPIVSFETGQISGMEALLRWHHPLEGMVPPNQFIRLAEETGLIVSISRWVLREACRQASAWRAQLPASLDFYVSVNLSGQDLRQPDLCDFVSKVLRDTSLPKGVLRLEVTEGIMIGNVQAASDLVAGLRELGVPLLLDDFGTGYSSLSYLHRFKFDFVKIDRAFVSRITSKGENTGIIRAIVHLADDLGMKTIAEGVESSEQMQRLRALGCDFGQGSYFSMPVDCATAEKLMLSRPSW